MRSRIPSTSIMARCFIALLFLCGHSAQAQAVSSSPAPEAKASPQQASSDSRLNQSTQVKAGETAQAESLTQSAAAEKKDDATKGSNAGKSKWHVRLGAVTAGGSYFGAPDGFLLSPFYPYSWYPYSLPYSAFYNPFSAPFYYPYPGGFAYAEDKGKVELTADAKNAEVYLDGAYAGLAVNLKRMWLRPGAYDLAVVAPDGSAFHQRIYVLSQKSLKIRAKLVPPNVSGKPEEKQP